MTDTRAAAGSGCRVGQFELVRLIASGGMGSVWYATHTRLGVPAAIKFLAADAVAHAGMRSAFAREAEAMAGLEHPGIAIVYDFGEVAESFFGPDGTYFEAGTPYLAMEYASRGSLDQIRLPIRWLDLYRILRAVLAALAYAHAHGVIHRDIKPANILLGSHEDLRPQLKLTDFGIAWTDEMRLNTPADEQTGTAVGTPLYMAPEQVWMRWRDYGPATDLYALGVVAWELSTGSVPFRRPTVLEVVAAHAREPLPEYDSIVVDAPDGFEAWIRRLLEKAPEDRYTFAADAIRALDALLPGHVEAPAWVPAPAPRQPEPTAPTWVVPPLGEPDATTMPSMRRPAPAVQPVRRFEVPDWRDQLDLLIVPRLRGVGVGLIGLRRPPLIGVVDQRETLWGTLRTVAEGHRTALTVVTGDVGSGRSVLAGWFAARAHELGVAGYARVSSAGDRDGIASLIEQIFGLQAMDLGLRVQRVQSRLQARGLDVAPALRIAEASVPGCDAKTIGRPADRRSAALDALRAAASERPFVVVVDELDELPELALVAEECIETLGRVLPVCFVGVADSLEGIAAAAPRLHARPDVAVAHLGRMSRDEARQFLDGFLKVDRASQDRLIDAADGNVLALYNQFVESISHGKIEYTDDGFRIVASTAAPAPDNLVRSILNRAANHLAPAGPGALEAVLVASLIGEIVPGAAFASICQQLGVADTNLVVELLMRMGHAASHMAGWSFVSPTVFEAYRTEARRDPVACAQRHGRCADALRAPGVPPQWRADQDIVAHLSGAGRLLEAIPVAARAAEALMEAGQPRAALDVLAERMIMCQRIGQTDTDLDFVLGLAIAADVRIRLGELPAAEALAQRAHAAAVAHGWTPVRARTLDTLAFVDRAAGRSARACERGSEACRLFFECGDANGLANARLNLAHSLHADRKYNEAQQQFLDVARYASGAEEPLMAGRAYLGLAMSAASDGDRAAANAAVSRAQALFQQVGHAGLLERCRTFRAELNASR